MTKLPRRLDGESPERSAIRKVRWLSELCSHPAIWVVSIKRGSTRAFSPVPAGRGIRPVWIGATCAHWIPATIMQSETICWQGNRLVPLWRPGHEEGPGPWWGRGGRYPLWGSNPRPSD